MAPRVISRYGTSPVRLVATFVLVENDCNVSNHWCRSQIALPKSKPRMEVSVGPCLEGIGAVEDPKPINRISPSDKIGTQCRERMPRTVVLST